MKSPFPGMDPYLERHWRDVHGSLVFLAKKALQAQLGEGLIARSEERLIVEEAGEYARSIYPDVRVVEHGLRGPLAMPGYSGIAVAEPLVLQVESEPLIERFVEILDTSAGGRVVTVIEFISPTNKRPGEGQRQYQKKQQECVTAGVNLAEIDLTRQGDRKLLVSRGQVPPAARATYQACIYRAWIKGRSGLMGQYELYGLPLQSRLPAIRIPLREQDADVALDLQSLVDGAYEAGGYGRTLNYHRPPEPALSVEDTGDWHPRNNALNYTVTCLEFAS